MDKGIRQNPRVDPILILIVKNVHYSIFRERNLQNQQDKKKENPVNPV